MHTGELVRELRLRRGLTQAEMARVVGMQVSQYARLERRGSCTVRTLERVARAVGMRLLVVFEVA